MGNVKIVLSRFKDIYPQLSNDTKTVTAVLEHAIVIKHRIKHEMPWYKKIFCNLFFEEYDWIDKIIAHWNDI